MSISFYGPYVYNNMKNSLDIFILACYSIFSTSVLLVRVGEILFRGLRDFLYCGASVMSPFHSMKSLIVMLKDIFQELKISSYKHQIVFTFKGCSFNFGWQWVMKALNKFWWRYNLFLNLVFWNTLMLILYAYCHLTLIKVLNSSIFTGWSANVLWLFLELYYIPSKCLMCLPTPPLATLTIGFMFY